MTSVETIRQSTRNAMAELLDLAKVREGQLFVVGCSTSEIVGKKIGTDSHLDVAQVVFDEIYNAVKDVADQRGYSLVIDRSSSTSGIIYGSPKVDISNEVLAKLGYGNQ